MKRNVTMLRSLVGMLLLTLIWACQTETHPIQVERDEAPAVSGAYESLNFLGDRQMYPETQLPENAHYAAWEKEQIAMSEQGTRRSTTDPWETMGPHNRGGRTLALAFNPQNTNTMYAGSASGGLWRTYSGGVGIDAWERVPTGFPVLGVSYIEFAPGDSTVMYIGTGEVYNYFAAGTGAAYRSTRGSYGIGILKSTDGGVSWTKSLDWSYDQNRGVWAIKVDPQNANIVYAATTEGVYKSIDAGANWQQVLSVVMATDIVVHPDNPNLLVATCGNFNTPGFGFYRSEDGGLNWTQIFSNLPSSYAGKAQLKFAPSNPDILYASIGNGFSFADGATWLCRSDDFGLNWSVQTQLDYSAWQGWFAHDVAVSPTNPNDLVAVGIEVWRSEDAGVNLLQEATGGIGFPNPPIEGPDGDGDFVHSDCHDVIYHPTNPNIVYIASDGGIHRSTDGGQTWFSANGRYQTAQFYNGFSTSVNDPGFCMGGLQDNGTIRWNGDLTWRLQTGGDGSWTGIASEDGLTFFTSYQNLNLLRTFDGGNYFSGIDMGAARQGPIAFIAPYLVAPSDNLVMYAGSSVVGYTSDGGFNWTALNNGQQLDGNPILSMTMSETTTDVVYAATAPLGTNRGHVFVTTDGNLFTDITGDLPDRYPMDMTIDPTNDATAYITYSGFGTGHVFKTEDYGASWTDISGTLPDVPTNAVVVDPVFPNIVYVGNDLGIYASVDGGFNWEPFEEGLPEAVMVFDLKISPIDRKLRMATHGNGAFQRDLLENPPIATENIEVKQLDLAVSPNPMLGPAVLEYQLEENGRVQVIAVDAAGRQIASLFQGELSAGPQQLNFDVSSWPAGSYRILLNGGGVRGQMQVVKY